MLQENNLTRHKFPLADIELYSLWGQKVLKLSSEYPTILILQTSNPDGILGLQFS
jgi:hypothetical protein